MEIVDDSYLGNSDEVSFISFVFNHNIGISFIRLFYFHQKDIQCICFTYTPRYVENHTVDQSRPGG